MKFLVRGVLLLVALAGAQSGQVNGSDLVETVILLSSGQKDGGSCPCGANHSLAVAFTGGECACTCLPYYAEPANCSPCPEKLINCADTCCYIDGVYCDEGGVCRSTDTLDFMTAAKIAVLFALTVTCLAALVAMFRAFLLPLCRPRVTHQRTCSQSDNRSLNSVQRFVLDRLINRPPPYEYSPDKPPTYDECVASGLAEEASPPYEADIRDVSSSPPPYSISAIMENSGTTSPDRIHHQEISSVHLFSNPTFEQSSAPCDMEDIVLENQLEPPSVDCDSRTPSELLLAVRPASGFGAFCAVVSTGADNKAFKIEE